MTIFFRALLTLSLLASVQSLVSVEAFAESSSTVTNENCVSKSEMAKIAEHFSQFRQLANSDFCYDDSTTSHLIAGLMFMRQTAFAPNMPKSGDELFSARFGGDWYEYFIGRITDFEIPSNCPKGVAAYVYMFGSTMYVCPYLLSKSFSALDRASVMMHEARHIDGYPHITCSQGPRAGMRGACDERISDGGSYAVTVETYAQAAKYAGELHPALRSYARAAAVVYADETFETPARVTRSHHLKLMTKTGDFYLFKLNRSEVAIPLGKSPMLGRIIMRGQFNVLLPDDRNEGARYVFTHNEGEVISQPSGALADYNKQTPAERANLIDVQIGTQWTAVAFNDRLRLSCNPNSDAMKEYSLNGEAPVGMIYLDGYNRERLTGHLLTNAGNVYAFGCDARYRPSFAATGIKFDRQFKRIYKIEQQTFGLGIDGKLYLVDGSSSVVIPTELDGNIYEIMPGQSFEFFDSVETSPLAQYIW